MADSPNHRNEQTGNPALDRIQNNVRDLTQFVKVLLARIVGAESAHGTGKLAKVELRDGVPLTLTAAQLAAGYWIFTGTLTGPATVHISRATDTSVYSRWVYNFTSGAQDVGLTNDDGTLTLVNGAGTHMIVTSSYGPETWL